MGLDGSVYRAGDVARLTLRVTNHSKRPFKTIKVGCSWLGSLPSAPRGPPQPLRQQQGSCARLGDEPWQQSACCARPHRPQIKLMRHVYMEGTDGWKEGGNTWATTREHCRCSWGGGAFRRRASSKPADGASLTHGSRTAGRGSCPPHACRPPTCLAPVVRRREGGGLPAAGLGAGRGGVRQRGCVHPPARHGGQRGWPADQVPALAAGAPPPALCCRPALPASTCTLAIWAGLRAIPP